MSIPVTCTHCQRKFPVKDRFEGAKGFCPLCGSDIEVPCRVVEVEDDDSDLHVLSTDTMSLLTQVALATCTNCAKSMPEDSPTCFFCGAPNVAVADFEPSPDPEGIARPGQVESAPSLRSSEGLPPR